MHNLRVYAMCNLYRSPLMRFYSRVVTDNLHRNVMYVNVIKRTGIEITKAVTLLLLP